MTGAVQLGDEREVPDQHMLQTSSPALRSAKGLSADRAHPLKEVDTASENTIDERKQDTSRIRPRFRHLSSLDPTTQGDIISNYKLRDKKLRDDGLYNCDYIAYLYDLLLYTILGILSYHFLHRGRYTMSGIRLGMLWHQLVFTVHDAGHTGIAHNYHVDSCIGMFIANFLGGLSCCW